MDTLVRYILLRLAVLVVIVCTMLLIMSKADADEYLGGGVGMFSNAKHTPAEVKFAQAGFRDYLGLGFFNQYEAGGWFQVDEGDGRKSSAYISDQLGVEASDAMTMRVSVGPAIITTPDSYLGGLFQFHEAVFLGVRGTNGNEIGFAYHHFSSAGLEMPNQGRDFGAIEVSLPF